jgi:hypothetical protein
MTKFREISIEKSPDEEDVILTGPFDAMYDINPSILISVSMVPFVIKELQKITGQE